MDTLTLNIDGFITDVKKENILDIKDGKALTLTKRWYDIVCDCEDYEQPTDDYIVCNICNKVTYMEDLKWQDEVHVWVR